MQVEKLLENGFIILDKWQGPTSRGVCETIRKILNLKKVGHSGTLDKNVSGVLLVTLENACKVIPAIQGLDKEYVGVMHLHRDVSNEELEQAIKKFIGEIIQKPPVKSAVARIERKRKIYSIEILDKVERDVLLQVRCEAGTYIRKLFDDIGKTLGVGAHMKELRRTKVGNFNESHAVKMQDLAGAYRSWKEKQMNASKMRYPIRGNEEIIEMVLPVERAVDHLKKIYVKDSALRSILNGSPLYTSGIEKSDKNIVKGNRVALFSSNTLIALARANMGSEEFSQRGLAAKTDRIIKRI